jgi:hypothetical protein
MFNHVDETFYGFRVDSKTSSLTVEVISGESPIVLPQEGFIDSEDYKQWLWSRNAHQFDWSATGHLRVKVV